MRGLCTLLTYWALTLCFAERQYFSQTTQLSWTEARKHCQHCFSDLVALTPENAQAVARSLTLAHSAHWIGLRRNAVSTTNVLGYTRSRMPWSHWANGELLIFQNWNPGSPVLSPFATRTDGCTCPCSLSSSSSSSCFSDAFKVNSSGAPVQPIHSPYGYVYDSCVLMLSSGTWVEKSCSELHPFVCFEDRFFGQLILTHRTSSDAVLQWSHAPGTISRYRVEVKGDAYWVDYQTSLKHHFTNLTAGQLYSVQVFPIKCDRDLNPQNVSFYTMIKNVPHVAGTSHPVPNTVRNLTITNVTETSLFLSWSKPDGKLDFYEVRTAAEDFQTQSEGRQFDGLTPGSCYTFDVFTGVADGSTRSSESHVAAFTRPEKVLNLTVSDNTNDSLLLSWEEPVGRYSGFHVLASNDNYSVLFEVVVSQNLREVRVTDLPTGSRITLVVSVQTNHTLEGDSVTVVNYTTPGPIPDLGAVTGFNHLRATWKPPVGNYSFFIVKLLLDGNLLETREELTEAQTQFDDLQTTANYTVEVQAVSGHLKGPTSTRSIFTLPLPPTDANVTAAEKSSLTFEWKAPESISRAIYGVSISSSFWGHGWSATVSNQTTHTFDNLVSGTKYMFEVHTVGDGLNSSSANCSAYTVIDEREISLSMLCSSSEPLLCDNSTVRESVFSQLQEHVYSVFRDDILWTLEKDETPSNAAA